MDAVCGFGKSCMDVSVSTAELLDGVLSLRCLFPAGVLLVVWLAAVLWIFEVVVGIRWFLPRTSLCGGECEVLLLYRALSGLQRAGLFV